MGRVAGWTSPCSVRAVLESSVLKRRCCCAAGDSVTRRLDVVVVRRSLAAAIWVRSVDAIVYVGVLRVVDK